MSTLSIRLRAVTVVTAIAFLTVGMAGCAATTETPIDDPTVSAPADPVEPDPSVERSPSGEPQRDARGCLIPWEETRLVAVDSAPLVSADAIPDGLCAYTNRAGGQLFVVPAEHPNDTFVASITAWLEAAGWTLGEQTPNGTETEFLPSKNNTTVKGKHAWVHDVPAIAAVPGSTIEAVSILLGLEAGYPAQVLTAW